MKHTLLKQICRLTENKQLKILTGRRALCPWITVRFLTMDRLWPGFLGLWFGLSKSLLLQDLLLFFPKIFLLDQFSTSLLFFFAYSVLLSFATEKQTQRLTYKNFPHLKEEKKYPFPHYYRASSLFCSTSASSCCFRIRASSALRCCFKRNAARFFANSSSAFCSSCKIHKDRKL